MPLFNIPPLSSSKYHDGTDIAPGDNVVPYLVIVDANNKITVIKSNSIILPDTGSPVITGFEVTQGVSDYVFTPSAGSVIDNTSGNIDVYHIVVIASETPLTSSTLLTLATSQPGNVGSHTVVSNTPGSNVPVSEMSLATSKVYVGSNTFREIAEGDEIVNYLLAVGPGDLKSASYLSTGVVAGR